MVVDAIRSCLDDKTEFGQLCLAVKIFYKMETLTQFATLGDKPMRQPMS